MDEIKILRLHLKKKYWEQIKAGTKTLEYRLANDYWRKRLVGRSAVVLILFLGFISLEFFR